MDARRIVITVVMLAGAVAIGAGLPALNSVLGSGLVLDVAWVGSIVATLVVAHLAFASLVRRRWTAAAFLFGMTVLYVLAVLVAALGMIDPGTLG